MKEGVCYVESKFKVQMGHKGSDTAYKLPNGEVLKVPGHLRTEIPELMFEAHDENI